MKLNVENIKRAMTLKGWNWSALSSRSGVAKSWLSRCVNGHKTPSAKMAKKLAVSLGISIKRVVILEEPEGNQ